MLALSYSLYYPKHTISSYHAPMSLARDVHANIIYAYVLGMRFGSPINDDAVWDVDVMLISRDCHRENMAAHLGGRLFSSSLFPSSQRSQTLHCRSSRTHSTYACYARQYVHLLITTPSSLFSRTMPLTTTVLALRTDNGLHHE
jgi:hypothetical protein